MTDGMFSQKSNPFDLGPAGDPVGQEAKKKLTEALDKMDAQYQNVLRDRLAAVDEAIAGVTVLADLAQLAIKVLNERLPAATSPEAEQAVDQSCGVNTQLRNVATSLTEVRGALPGLYRKLATLLGNFR